MEYWHAKVLKTRSESRAKLKTWFQFEVNNYNKETGKLNLQKTKGAINLRTAQNEIRKVDEVWHKKSNNEWKGFVDTRCGKKKLFHPTSLLIKVLMQHLYVGPLKFGCLFSFLCNYLIK